MLIVKGSKWQSFITGFLLLFLPLTLRLMEKVTGGKPPVLLLLL